MVFSSIPDTVPAPWFGYTTRSPFANVLGESPSLCVVLPFPSAILSHPTGGLEVPLALQVPLDSAGARLAHAFHLVELLLRGVEEPLEGAELVDDVLGDLARQPGHPYELPVAARLDEKVFRLAHRAVSQELCDLHGVGELLVGELSQGLLHLAVVHILVNVVLEQSVVLLRDALERLLELQLDQPALAPEFPHVRLYLLGDPDRVLEGSDSAYDLAQRDRSVVLVDGQVPGLLAQPPRELLEGGDRRVGLGEDDAYVFEDVRPVGAAVQAHDHPTLGDRNHQVSRLLSRAVRGEMPHPGLLGLERRVRVELHVGVVDGGEVGRDDDRAVHLGQLVQAHRRELQPDLHPTRDDPKPLQLLWQGHHDERPIVRPNNVLDGVPQIRARGHEGEHVREVLGQVSPPGAHRRATATASSSVFTSTTLAFPFAEPSFCALADASCEPSGFIIRPNPSLSSSEVLRGAPETNRTSPVSPTSP